MFDDSTTPTITQYNGALYLNRYVKQDIYTSLFGTTNNCEIIVFHKNCAKKITGKNLKTNINYIKIIQIMTMKRRITSQDFTGRVAWIIKIELVMVMIIFLESLNMNIKSLTFLT